MNLAKLAQAESFFLSQYPAGFRDEGLQGMTKKHPIDKLTHLAQERFRKVKFNDIEAIVESMVQVVAKSSMVSLFEKPKYRDALLSMSSNEKVKIAEALRKQLHGNREKGFNEMLSCLEDYKLAKWTLISTIPFYFKPQTNYFVKPTTAKKIIAFLELTVLVYQPRPSWTFYQLFEQQLDEVKAHVADSLSPSTAALTGFLMMSIQYLES